MYEFMQGQVADVTPQYLVLTVGAIGYRVLVTNPYAYTSGQELRLYVQLIIRENDQTLYGFATAADKQTFNQLLTVTGIGPKSALAILANAHTEGLAQAIAQDDVGYLTKFPGIGKKTAQQIILDLKGKLAPKQQAAQKLQATAAGNPQLEDALAALMALGYPDKAVAKVKKTLAASAETTTDAYMRLGLQLLSQ